MKQRVMNNLGFKILAFLTAGMLWLVMVNIDDPVTTKTYHGIPVSVINEEVLSESNQTYLITDNTQTVSVTVKAKRKTLNSITAENISAAADMRELTLNTQIPVSVTINGYEGQYESAEANPRNLLVKLEDELTKKFPIVPATDGIVQDGYALGEIKAVPAAVSLRGAESVIDRISRVEANVSVSGLSEDVVLPSELVLYDEENEVIDQALLTNNLGTSGVSVSVQILRTKSVPVRFDTAQTEAAEGYSIGEISYEPGEIQVAGTAEELNGLSEIAVPVEVLAMSDLQEKTEQVVDITPYLPEGIQLVDENAGSVMVTINVDKDGARTYSVNLGAIVAKNLADDLTLIYETVDVIEIRIRGAAAVLAEYEIDDYVTMDLKEYEEPGKYTVPVDIELPQGCVLEEPVTVDIVLEEKE